MARSQHDLRRPSRGTRVKTRTLKAAAPAAGLLLAAMPGPACAAAQPASRGADERLTAPLAPAVNTARTRRLGRLAGWLTALVADNGMSERFATERQRDEELVERVDRQRRV